MGTAIDGVVVDDDVPGPVVGESGGDSVDSISVIVSLVLLVSFIVVSSVVVVSMVDSVSLVGGVVPFPTIGGAVVELLTVSFVGGSFGGVED